MGNSPQVKLGVGACINFNRKMSNMSIRKIRKKTIIYFALGIFIILGFVIVNCCIDKYNLLSIVFVSDSNDYAYQIEEVFID